MPKHLNYTLDSKIMTIDDQNRDFIGVTPIKHEIIAPAYHWQLRDMIKPHPRGILYSNTEKVAVYDPKTQEREVLFPSMYFTPTSIAHHDGLVAVVGNKGQLLVIKESVHKAVIGGTINNSVQIYGDPPRIYVCSNDGSIKIYDGVCFRLLQIIKHKYPINNCAVSPDGKKLVAVGDTPHVFQYYYSEGFVKYDVSRCVNDAGFKVSWNNTSDIYAISTQDGYVCVWDIRKKEKIHAIPSKQRGSPKGAIRAVEFSRRNNLDLLLFTEHVKFINFIDTRNYVKRQSIAICTSQYDESISGSFFSDDGNSVFVSVEDNVFEYKINKESRRYFDSYSSL